MYGDYTQFTTQFRREISHSQSANKLIDSPRNHAPPEVRRSGCKSIYHIYLLLLGPFLEESRYVPLLLMLDIFTYDIWIPMDPDTSWEGT